MKLYHVTISFARDKAYGYEFSDADLAESSPEEARRWFDKEFADLSHRPNNPVGKVLIIDKILEIARSAGDQPFTDGKSWAAKFALYTALALGRDTIRVDVATSAIGY